MLSHLQGCRLLWGVGEAEGAPLCTQLLVKTIICAPVHGKVPVPLHTDTCVVSSHHPVRVLGRFHSQALFVLSLLMLRPGPRAHRSSAVFGFDRPAPTALPGMSLGGCAVVRVVCEEEEKEEGAEAGSWEVGQAFPCDTPSLPSSMSSLAGVCSGVGSAEPALPTSEEAQTCTKY